jgi:hypothetical protein
VNRTIVTLIVSALALWVGRAAAQDFGEYTALVERANAAHRLLEDAPESRRDALRETALDADLAVIEWLDAFLGTASYQQLPEEQQQLVVRNRYRWEYNVAALLIPLDRCDEARDRVRALLDRPMNDPELRPRLTEAYDNAIQCATRVRTARLRVEANPAHAEVFVDGVLAGLAGAELEVPLGEREVLVRAEGFVSESRRVSAAREGELVTVGPLALMLEQSVEPDRRPTWYEWTLWTAGAVGLGVGLYYFFEAADRQDTLDNPPAGFRVADEAREEGIVDDLRLVSFLAGGVGLACVLAGTISYATRDKELDRPARPPGGEARVGLGLGRVVVDVRF